MGASSDLAAYCLRLNRIALEAIVQCCSQIHPRTRAVKTALVSACLTTVIATAGCPEQSRTGGDEPAPSPTQPSPEPGPEAPLFEVETRVLDGLNPILSRGLGLAVRSDGRWAIAYNAPGQGTYDCTAQGGTVEGGDNTEIRIVEDDGAGGESVRVVETIPGGSTQSLDLAVDPQDNLVVTYGGGAIATLYCGPSDLVVARESGGSFTAEIVATTSATSSPCRLDANGEDPYCQIGDVVGLFPSVAVDADGTVAVAYQDLHGGFANEDVYGADLELARGSGGFNLTTISSEAGAGYHTDIAFGPSGRVIVGDEIIGNGIFVTPDGVEYELGIGLYVAVEREDGTYAETNLLPDANTDYRVAVGYDPSFGYAVAAHDGGGDQLLFWSSADGETWDFEPVDRIGLTGRSPALAFLSDGRPVVAYRHCGNPSDTACNPAVDGVKVAVRGSGGWETMALGGDDEILEGTELNMTVGPEDRVYVVSMIPSTQRMVLHTLTPR